MEKLRGIATLSPGISYTFNIEDASLNFRLRLGAPQLDPDFERQEGVPSTQEAPHRRQALQRGHWVHRPTGTASSRSRTSGGTARRFENSKLPDKQEC